MRHLGLIITAIVATISSAHAETPFEVKMIDVVYKQGNTELQGTLAIPEATTVRKLGEKLPAVIVCPEWTGPNDYARGRAKQLAELGYIAFVADVYGKDVRPKEMKEYAATSAIYKADRPLLRQRIQAALNVLLNQPKVDPKRVAVIGYCFGGLTALELARDGAPVAAVVSFHGELTNPTPADAAKIKGKVLILHGAIDPFVPIEQVDQFEAEMNKTKVDYQIVKYSGAVHAFTNPGAKMAKQAEYEANADRRSFAAMLALFAETIDKP